MLSRLLKIYGVLIRTHGFTLRPLGTLLIIGLHHALVSITWLLDHLFYGGFRRRKVDRPIFIIGNPRSGTTFLHRFLHECGEVASFQLWQMVFPSLTAQKLLRPLIGRLARINPARHHKSMAHETGLKQLETDDAALFLRFIDGMFLWAYFLAWDEADHSHLFHLDDPALPMNRRDLRFYHKMLLRNLHKADKGRVLGKWFTFTIRVKTVLQRYPDARLIYLVRDPASVIPSGMSLITGVLEQQYHIDRLDPAIRQRYYDRIYEGECWLFKSFHDLYTSGQIPERNLLVVRFPDLMQDLAGTMERIRAFTGLSFSPAYLQKIAETDEKQKAYSSKHSYDLQRFGLSEQKIRQDLAEIYETFDL